MAENEFEVSGEQGFDWSNALRAVSAQEYDPYSQFTQFATGFRPSERQALNKLYEPLSARYALGGVGVPAFQGYGLGGQAIAPRQFDDFRSYLTGYDPAGSNRMSFDNMISRAQRARDISALSSSQFKDLYGGLGSDDARRSAAWARYMYEASPEAGQNQMRLAQLLALQRPDGAGGQGEYGGIMRSAISSAMNELYNARLSQNRSPNSFLDWYLTKTGRRGDQALADYGLSNVLPESQVMGARIAEDMMRGDIPTAPSNLNYATVPPISTNLDQQFALPTQYSGATGDIFEDPYLSKPLYSANNAPEGSWNDFMQEDASLSMFTNDAFKKWAVNKGINLGMLNRDEAKDAWNMFTREQPLSIPRFNYNVTQTPTPTPTQTPINSTLPSVVNSTLPSLTTSPTPTPTPTPLQYSGATGDIFEDPYLTKFPLYSVTNSVNPYVAGSDYGLSNVMPLVEDRVPSSYPNASMGYMNRSTETPMEKIRRLQIDEDLYRMGGGM